MLRKDVIPPERFEEIDMKINGSSDWYDLRAVSIERRQESFIDAPEVPNTGNNTYVAVDYVGFGNPRWIIEGVFDDTQAEQWIESNVSSGQATVVVADASKFSVGEKVYVWDSAGGEDKTIGSISGTTLTMTTNFTRSYTYYGDANARDAKIRSRQKIGKTMLKYFLETSAEKVLRDPILAPTGVCVQITSIDIQKSSESHAPSSSPTLISYGAVMKYSMECIETNGVVY